MIVVSLNAHVLKRWQTHQSSQSHFAGTVKIPHDRSVAQDMAPGKSRKEGVLLS